MMPPPSFINPLVDPNQSRSRPESCILVIFGATGDLTARKLLPALYHLAQEGQLPPHFACVGYARREKTTEEFRQEMAQAVKTFSRSGNGFKEEVWQAFAQRLFYFQGDFDQPERYHALSHFLTELDVQFNTKGNRVFYLSTPPSFFAQIVERLWEQRMLYSQEIRHKWSRVIIEKPFGTDFASARALQKELTAWLDEKQIYRIDHYLGKETVQNLLIFRFGNAIFESIWNRNAIDHVQITVAEEIGIGTRGKFFEEAGMLRDIVQNHAMQLLTLVAMEAPTSLQPHAIHHEKIKVLESIRQLSESQFVHRAIRAQYTAGWVEGERVKGYREENNVSPQSMVETFVALRCTIDNWRWSGVPFYIRAGKRLVKRATEIAVFFKHPPQYLFAASTASMPPNALIIRIQPGEGISLTINSKVPSQGTLIQPVKMDFRYSDSFGSSPPDAYERLICDCMAGDKTLFARDDEVFLSWQFLDPLLSLWKQDTTPLLFYPSGSWGPEEAGQILLSPSRWRTP